MEEMKISDYQKMKVELGDLTTYGGTIVNAANESLLGGGGVDGAIHRAAGPELLEECRTLHGCKTGQAKITKGYNLKADYVIHTVGPVYSIHREREALLEKCYKNCLNVALENQIHEISFPSISTGVYGYPKEEAAEIAVRTVKKWLSDHTEYEMLVRFVCFGRYDYSIYKEIFQR